MNLNATNPNPTPYVYKRPRGRPYKQSAKSLETRHLDLLEKWRFLAENNIPMNSPIRMEQALQKAYGLSRKTARSYARTISYMRPQGHEKNLPKDFDDELMKRRERKKPFPR